MPYIGVILYGSYHTDPFATLFKQVFCGLKPGVVIVYIYKCVFYGHFCLTEGNKWKMFLVQISDTRVVRSCKVEDNSPGKVWFDNVFYWLESILLCFYRDHRHVVRSIFKPLSNSREQWEWPYITNDVILFHHRYHATYRIIAPCT